jgi:hypothetical protein
MIGIKMAYMDVEWEKEKVVEEVKVEEEIVEEEKSIDEKYPLWEKLPYYGDGFVVERYESELTLVVENRNEEVIETIKEINNWFWENNIATDSHRLIITNQVEN